MESTGERIRRARERAVYGQAELARAAGLSVAGLWQIEHGQRQPRPATIRKIAGVLGVSPSELLAAQQEQERRGSEEPRR